MKKKINSVEHHMIRDSRNFQRGYNRDKLIQQDLLFLFDQQMGDPHGFYADELCELDADQLHEVDMIITCRIDLDISRFIFSKDEKDLQSAAYNLFFYLLDDHVVRLLEQRYNIDMHRLMSRFRDIMYGQKPYLLNAIFAELSKVPEFAEKIQTKKEFLEE